MKQILLTLVFSVVNTWSAWALDFGFRHLNTSNGLPNQQVEAIVDHRFSFQAGLLQLQ